MSNKFFKIAEVSTIYRLHDSLPIKVGDRSLEFYISDRPPLAVVEFRTPRGTSQVGIYRGVEHAKHVLKNGLKVGPHALVVPFIENLVKEGRASVVAGPHCPVIWLVDPKSPRVELDAYFTWRGDHGDFRPTPP